MSKTTVFFKTILAFLEKISDAIYGFFYDKKMARVGYVLTTPLYWAERLTIWVWDLTCQALFLIKKKGA